MFFSPEELNSVTITSLSFALFFCFNQCGLSIIERLNSNMFLNASLF